MEKLHTSFSTRLLPPEEWHKLAGTEPGKIIHVINKESSNIMVVEKDDTIVGSWSLIPYYHAECVWIREDFRNSAVVARRLITGMEQMANALGISSVITASTNKRVDRLIRHLKSKKLPGQHYVIHFGS